MYSKVFPFKDFKGNPRNIAAHFNLTEREIFGLLEEFQSVFQWRESIQGAERILETSEIVEFYNNLEEILLSAWGEPSDDGLYFEKSGRYRFKESALFNAVMLEFVTNVEEATKFLDEMMPKDMEELIKKTDANLIAASKKEGNSEELNARIAELQAQLEAARASE